MALKTAYATAVLSDTYLADKADWLALTSTVKDSHLLNATYYLDKHYVCTFTTPIQDEAGYACSLLAYHDFITGLYTVDGTNGSPIVEDTVNVGGVLVKTKYSGANATAPMGRNDRYPDATAILGGICYLKNAGGLVQGRTVR